MSLGNGSVIGSFKIRGKIIQSHPYRIIDFGNILFIAVKELVFNEQSVDRHEIHFITVHIGKNMQQECAVDIIDVLFYSMRKVIEVTVQERDKFIIGAYLSENITDNEPVSDLFQGIGYLNL